MRDQEHRPFEILVVDDGSSPPLDGGMLTRQFGYPIKVLRHSEQHGVASARLTGAQAAMGDVIVFCDDDDRLAHDALQIIAETFRAWPDIEVLFFNVNAFGPGADAFAERQHVSLNRLMENITYNSPAQDLSVFDETLFIGLLGAVPQAFQRTAATTAAWHRVTTLREQIYRRSLGLSAGDNLIGQLENMLTECEWALLASLTCSTALHHRPLYELRCHGERYYSRPELRGEQEAANRRIKQRLMLATDLPELHHFRADIRSSAARGWFHAAYYEFQNGSRSRAWQYMLNATRIELQWQFVAFGLRTLLPRRGKDD